MSRVKIVITAEIDIPDREQSQEDTVKEMQYGKEMLRRDLENYIFDSGEVVAIEMTYGGIEI